MPQHHTATGTFSYVDSKSAFPAFPKVGLGSAVAIGIGAGFIGAFAMVGTNWIEQMITHRPASYVPARTIGNHFGVTPQFYERNVDLLNNIHHHGMGMIAGAVRGVFSYYGVIGPFASFVHTGIRIALDQVMENTAGTSALPWTWPINEQVIDTLHKGAYALITGYLCDYWIRGVNWFN
ncbi:hypothetical protein GRF29_213g675742 [Pseudopithomyces chartarum]|uniref:Uncharacterized protein n=1 Tax=Pseudopithomyces chartarum TaxID=1892770 RepID=A0AAN6LMW6_9PLEO|nr:hypothetical protein GRF29_213g675742 [Pseudopithomyces chartarum]